MLLYDVFMFGGEFMNLSENLQNLRKAKGMSQEELAEKIRKDFDQYL